MSLRHFLVSTGVAGGLALAAVAPLVGQQPTPVKAAPAAFAGDSVHAGTFAYGGPDQATTVSVVASAVDGQPAWLFVEARQGARGVLLDSLFVDRRTLVPLRQVLRFIGTPYFLNVSFGPDSVAVKGVGDGGPMAVSFPAPHPVYVSGAALEAAIATLPLAPGYRVGFRVVDVLDGLLVDIEAQVTGIEHVRVAAGEFDAFRVETMAVKLGGGSVLWIERAAPHHVLRRGAEELKP